MIQLLMCWLEEWGGNRLVKKHANVRNCIRVTGFIVNHLQQLFTSALLSLGVCSPILIVPVLIAACL